MSSGYHQPRPEALRVPLRQCKALLRTSSAEPSSTSCPHGLDIHAAWLGLRGRAGKGGRRGRDLKIVPVSFLQLSFTARKRARGLPAPVHTAPYIMGDTRASLRAGSRQGRDVHAALPKPMSSSREPGPWKQPAGQGKQLAWLAGAAQPQPWAGEEARESAVHPKGEGWPLGMGCWQKAGRSCRAATVLLGQTAAGRGRRLWGGPGERPRQVPRGDCLPEGKMRPEAVEKEEGCRDDTGTWRRTGVGEQHPRRIRNWEGESRRRGRSGLGEEERDRWCREGQC